MNSRIPLLLGLLAIQVLIIGVASIDFGDGGAARSFLKIETDLVSGLTISDAEGSVVQLSKTDTGWELAGGLPADTSKIVGVIESLVEGAATWPVATSGSSQERFEVTEDTHQRRLTFTAGSDVLAEVFLGTSPGFRRVHARTAEEDAVYSIDFAVHEVPTDQGDWLNTSLLHTEEISRIVLAGGHDLVRDEASEGWRLGGEPTDPESVRRLVERVEQLSVLSLYDAGEEGLGEALVVAIEDGTGSYQLTFRHDEDDDDYVLTTDRFEGRFVVASYVVEQILINPEDLLVQPETEEVAETEDLPAAADMSSEVPAGDQ